MPLRAERELLARVRAADAVDARRREVEEREPLERVQHARQAREDALRGRGKGKGRRLARSLGGRGGGRLTMPEKE